jgi:hypothetical protein
MEGVAGKLRDKARPPRIPPLTAAVVADVVLWTLAEPRREDDALGRARRWPR